MFIERSYDKNPNVATLTRIKFKIINSEASLMYLQNDNRSRN